MQDDVRQRLKGTGPLQKKLLVWLGAVQGIKTPEDLRGKWPRFAPVRQPMDVISQAAEFLNQPVQKKTEFAPYLEDSYFSRSPNHEDPPLLEGDGWLDWDSREFLGHTPSQNESVALSKGIKSLERRGLIETAKVFGKKKRVSHLRLTFQGEVASVLLQVQAVPIDGRGLRG